METLFFKKVFISMQQNILIRDSNRRYAGKYAPNFGHTHKRSGKGLQFHHNCTKDFQLCFSRDADVEYSPLYINYCSFLCYMKTISLKV